TRPVHVLVVSEHDGPVVATALARRGMDVEVTAPSGFPASLDEHHAVVLDDVGRAALPDAALDAIARHVAAGGALVVTGGPHLFGDAGFAGTALEHVLPVALQSQRPEPKQREPIALYLLVDRSNSMGYATSEPALEYGEKMEYAKRAALAVVAQLGPRDLVGAIAFDSQPYELGPLIPLAEGRSTLETKIRQLKYGGGTDFKESLERARRALVAAGARVRHVILITDGDTNRRAEDHDDVIAALAKDDVTVTTIRIGSDTINLDLLAKISRATGGAFHHVEDVGALPQLMISDTQHVMDEAANRREAAVRVGEPGPLLAGIDEDELPRVSRWAIARAKPGADVRLWVEAGGRRDPLLATWQYGLGRVAAVPMDFQSGAATWPTWRGFAKLWSQLVMWAAPPGLASEPSVDARPVDGGTLVTVESRAASPPSALRFEDGREAELRPVGADRFVALVAALAPGVHPVTIVAGGTESTAEVAVPERWASGREERATGPNRALLERLAALSGGAMSPAPADVLRARPGVRRRLVPLDVVLIPLALGLVLADVALRRLRRVP
ncbi:MAG TPA: VWA domain-containing protein, partial [Candidatus Binatia bacterium]|nr:VWA domain-containing protein [Candidatus Binatia bacterium]